MLPNNIALIIRDSKCIYADLFANIDKMSASARSFVTLTHTTRVIFALRYKIFAKHKNIT